MAKKQKKLHTMIGIEQTVPHSKQFRKKIRNENRIRSCKQMAH